MKYTEKEVVEILTEYVGGMLPLKQFLKKKGLIKEEFEVGWLARDWKDGDVDVFLCTENTGNGYTYSPECYFRNGEFLPSLSSNPNVNKFDHRYTTRKATDKEVEAALIKEAKKRGFKEVVSCVWEDEGIYHRNMNGDLEYSIEGGYLKFGSYIIFDGGKWATIIEEPKEMTMAEVNKALGYEIKIKE